MADRKEKPVSIASSLATRATRQRAVQGKTPYHHYTGGGINGV